MDEHDIEFDEQLASSTSAVSINRLARIFADGDLELRPPFQRYLVWNDDQRSLLVDTVLRNLPIPEIYTRTETSAAGDERMIVIDGQQRISTLLKFLRSELRLDPHDTGEEFDARWRLRTFEELGDELKQRFREYKLVIRDLPRLTDGQMREIFRRLNKSVEPLEPQELRHAAFSGPFVQFVEQAGAHPVLSEVGVFSARDYRRRRNDEFMAEIAFALVGGAFPNKKDGLDQLFLTYERQGVPAGVISDLEARFGRVFEQLGPMAGAVRRTRFRNKSDFYSLFSLLAREAERLPLSGSGTDALEARLQAFSTLVTDIRQEVKEGADAEQIRSDADRTTAAEYLGAVERAATDRLRRVVRDRALQDILGPIVASGEVRPFQSADVAWTTRVEDDEAAESDLEAERLAVREALRSASDG